MPLLTVSPPPQIIMPDLQEFITTKEAAELLGFNVQTIRNMVYAEKLDSIKFGRSLLISKKSVKEYQEKNKGLSKNDPRRK